MQQSFPHTFGSVSIGQKHECGKPSSLCPYTSLGAPMTLKRKSRSSRLPLAITLIIAAFISTFLIATFSNKGDDYWVVNAPISPGHTISSSDLGLVHVNLNSSSSTYLDKSSEPIGMVATRLLQPNEIVAVSDLTNSTDAMSTSAVPLSVRGVDLATGLLVGECINLDMSLVGGLVKLTEKSAGLKDRYSAVSYTNWIISQEFDKALLKETDDSDEFSDVRSLIQSV